MLQYYKSLSEKHRLKYNQLKKEHTLIAILRLILMSFSIIMFWQFAKHFDFKYMLLGLLFLVGFITVLKFHQKKKYQRNLAQKLLEINEYEIAYLEHGKLSFEDGAEFLNQQHLYQYDLDIFGINSLYQHLNRTSTAIGKSTLAKKLSSKLDFDKIGLHQKGIKELADKAEFRQQFSAIAKMANLNQQGLNQLFNWSKALVKIPPIAMRIFSVLMPILFFSMTILSTITGHVIYTYLANTCFLLNLCAFALFLKRIKSELVEADKIHESIQLYAQILELIQHENFTSDYLIQLKEELIQDKSSAADDLKKLSQLFNQLSSIENPVGAVLFNGALMYHFGVYQKLLAWKQKNGNKIQQYLQIIGEFDALNSLANFSFNNQNFVFPQLNESTKIEFNNCGHPLIHSSKRIYNDVKFASGNFMILTGSNMSGKSTFLRTLGINMVLTNAGGPVCASEANVYPLPIIVSMRMNDSLSDGESYFFAEVKRLKQIMDELDEGHCFVLLDEILKGTNSDDKRQGTVKVIEKMLQKNVIGAIATHDLEVCNISKNYPEKLYNCCFEVEIVNNELYFDYKLRSGICKNKSATFLMNKMGVIDA